MSSQVRLAAMMPAICAVPSTSPLASSSAPEGAIPAPASRWLTISSSVSRRMVISPVAIASRRVSSLADTSTIRARPCSSMCDSCAIELSVASVAALADRRRPHVSRAPGDEEFHSAGGAVLRQLCFEEAVDVRILVLVLDLRSAFLHADVRLGGCAESPPAAAAAAQRQVPGRFGAGVEMLVDAVFPGHDHHASPTPRALPALLAFSPQQREARTRKNEQMRSRAVLVSLFVGPYRELRDMRREVRLGQLEHGVYSSGPPLHPAVQLQVARIRDEAGLPAAALVQLARATEELGLSLETIDELERVVENKLAILVMAQRGRQIRHRDVAQRLASAAVEMLVPGVEWDDKQAARSPFESLLALLVPPHAGGTAAGQDIDHLLV